MDKRILVILGAVIFALPALADSTSLAAKATQKTIKLDDKRFLVISSQPVIYQNEYGIELFEKDADGVVHSIPLTMEMYDGDQHSLTLLKSVGFTAPDYNFDSASHILEYGEKESGYGPTVIQRYQLIGNRLKLLKITKSEFTDCKPSSECDVKETIIYDNAQTN